MPSVLFICTANICRSPMAEGVFSRLLAERGAAVELDSAGTHDYYVGEPPFRMAVEAAQRRGYALANRVARRVHAGDLDHFDLVLAMDRSNVSSLLAMAPTACKGKVELLLDYGEAFAGRDVPDPFGGGAEHFDRALEMIEDGCRGLVELLAPRAPTGVLLRAE